VYSDFVTPVRLTSVRIRNLALVEDLTWSPGKGFTVVTGETGAGKSIIVGALKLLVGERADKALIRSGEDSCTVEGVFEVQDRTCLDPQLAELGLEPCEDGQLLIKRVLTSAGTNRQFINGSPTTLAVLKGLGDGLVDLHGPHDHQSILSPELQRALLDSFAGAAAPLGAYCAVYKQRGEVERSLAALHGDDAAFERECALLLFQANEVEAAGLKAGEEEDLLARYAVATQGKRILELLKQVLLKLVDAEDAALGKVAGVGRPLREIERLDPSAASLSAAHVRAVTELEELASELQRYGEGLELDPEHLNRLEDRVNLIESLKRKYGNTVEQIIAHGESAAERHQKLNSRVEERSRLQAEWVAVSADLESKAKTLRSVRDKAALPLAKGIMSHLKDLGFKRAEFAVHLEPLAQPGPFGMEAVEFRFAPNPGEPSKPLRTIASSGETSRVMLAVKSALAEQDTIPLLVFDEIDANVGGEIAHAVGAKMQALGKARQVLCISHLPQVAAKAAHHFVVRKDYSGGRTISLLQEVNGPERAEEVARMLGGKSESALGLARTLLLESTDR
jgi:DNA repair protein RecN (Recombination protein N)